MTYQVTSGLAPPGTRLRRRGPGDRIRFVIEADKRAIVDIK